MASANEAAALGFLAALARGEFDPQTATSDAVWTVWGIPDMPLEQFIAGLAATFRFPGQIAVNGVTAAGDRVAIEARSFLRTQDDRDYSCSYHYLLEFRDGLICHVTEYCDSAYANAFFGTDALGQKP